MASPMTPGDVPNESREPTANILAKSTIRFPMQSNQNPNHLKCEKNFMDGNILCIGACGCEMCKNKFQTSGKNEFLAK
jgi:hypothetical protein